MLVRSRRLIGFFALLLIVGLGSLDPRGSGGGELRGDLSGSSSRPRSIGRMRLLLWVVLLLTCGRSVNRRPFPQAMGF